MARDLLDCVSMKPQDEAQPKVPAEMAPAEEEDREHEGKEKKEHEGSVAPELPTSKGPRRSGAV